MFNSPLVISQLMTEDIKEQNATKHNSLDTVSKELYKIHSKDAGMSCGWKSQKYKRQTQCRLLSVGEMPIMLDT